MAARFARCTHGAATMPPAVLASELDAVNIKREYVPHYGPSSPRLFLSVGATANVLASHFNMRFSGFAGGASHPYAHIVRAILARNGCAGEGLSLPAYLGAMAALDPNTVHAGAWNVERSQYIFRAYDANNSGLLEFSEFVDMVRN
jgi:hypothetical protein